MLAAANGARNWADILANPPVDAADAIVKAALAENINVAVDRSKMVMVDGPRGDQRVQHFVVPGLKGRVRVELSWLPIDRDTMRLCWRVFLVSGRTREGFLVFVDALTGQVWFSQNLTAYQAAPAISMTVYTSDSPSPFSPGWPTPNSAQPPVVPRTHLTNITALNAVASPAGWVYPATNGLYVTAGNNAHVATDHNDDDEPDLPRPSVPDRNPDFTFPLDLARPPLTYSDASVVNLFYWINVIHDRMYSYGFTEAAGNYQDNNFGRGGFGGDPVIADAQDGARINDPNYRNNAFFVRSPDGIPGRIAMLIYDGPQPDRDSCLDAEVVLHEYTHGISGRLIGGGDVLFWGLQSEALSGGWADIGPLCLLSEPSDDPNGVYANAAYVAYMLYDLTENYYFGDRRYPYCTDMTKNPLTLKDIDPDIADPHLGVPMNPIFIGYNDPTEVHNMGEVWAIALWEVRANLVDSLGWDEGNSTMLQLIVDGMKLCPPNPTFLEARDAIVQADELTFGGLNKAEIWRGFAKRGMGYSARVPAANTTRGVVEAFDLPPDVTIAPPDGILEVYFTPAEGATLMAGSVAPIYVRVRDGASVTNATVKGVVNGVTPVTFNNAGTPPDARASDSIYSANISVPSTGTNLTISVTITAPGKQNATNSVSYFVATRPANDLFANAIKVRAEGAVLNANNRFADAALEPGEPNHAGASLVTSSLWWNWTAQSDGPVLVDTAGSKFNTLLAVYTGTSVNALKEVGSAQTKPGSRKAYVIFNAKKGQSYKIAVASAGTNYSGAITLAIVRNGTPDLAPPVVRVVQPVSGLIVDVNTVDLIASAFDPGPVASGVDKINVQVVPAAYRNGMMSFSPGGVSTTNRLALTPGYNTIKVFATDVAGNASEPITLTVTYRRNPVPNDHFNYAPFLPADAGTVTADTAEATREPGEPRHAENDGGHSVWWKFKAPRDGTVLLSTEGSSFDTLLGLYQGERVDSLRKIGANDDAFEGAGFSKLQQAVRSNQLYYVAVDGFNGATGKVQLSWSFAPAELRTMTLSATAGGRIKEHEVGVVDV
ncbi:MAG: M36 family metallopeptidase, partial [Verrucomicrobiae bacterium]|nr:M36 family metallopeptidase [Verrucomicrobiae bacterium]